jgi:phosphatidate phosphatase APP1
MILPYLGYGTRTRLALCGRVLQDEGIRPAAEGERSWRNFAGFFKRLESDELPFARVLARFRGLETEVRADREGFFRVEIPLASPVQPGWHEVQLALAEHPGVGAAGQVLVPPESAKFGIISDIDDTILQSNVTRKLSMLLTVALSNARTRKPFAGVAAFYRALAQGGNPFFYVSKSPWNLYAPLIEFMQHQGIPLGPLMLRDFGLSGRKSGRDHKARQIDAVMTGYGGLKFILVGDSGEQDPEIYREVVRRHPDRVCAIYIRSVDPDPARIAAVAKLAAEVAKTGCQLVLVPDSEFAAAHAAGEGFISPAALSEVRQDKNADRSP